MNLEITSRCEGNCSHCLSNCTEIGQDMDQKTFNQSLRFIQKSKSKVVNFGGGEPSMHPDVVYYGKQMQRECPTIVTSLISNGYFLKDDDLINNVLESFNAVQVTYDERFYPNFIDIPAINSKLPDIMTEQRIRSVLQYGRAIDNNTEYDLTRKSPLCFNMRSLIKLSNMGFIAANIALESKMKFCSWSILPDGRIVLSESMTCPSIGSIWDSFETLEHNIRNFNCKKCIYAQRLYESGLPYSAVFD